MRGVLELDVLLVVEELANGNFLAWPFAEPKAVAHGDSLESVLEQQELYLREHLASVDGDQLGRYDPHADAQLRMVDVPVAVELATVDRGGHRRPRTQTIPFPVAVVPDREGTWAIVLCLLDAPHVLWVDPTADSAELDGEPNPELEPEPQPDEDDPRDHDGIDARVRSEIQRVLGVRTLDGGTYLRLLRGADPYSLERLTVEVDREERTGVEARAASRRRRARERSENDARRLLGTIGTSMLVEAKRARLPPILHREREIAALDALLRGPERLALMLVGPELAGKTAVLHGLVQRWLELPKPSQRQLPEVVVTSGAQLVAGQSGFGQLEQRVHDVMAAAEILDAVLYFDNLADLFARTSGELGDVAASMHPWLERGRVRVVGELTPETLEHHEKRHVGFFAYLNRLAVDELTPEQTAAILRARAEHDARHDRNRPTLSLAGPSAKTATGSADGRSRDAVTPLVDLATRYLSYQAFPGKALRFYLSLRATQEGQLDSAGNPRAIGPEDVYRGFSIHSGIPMFLLRADRRLEHASVVAYFRERVIGQAEAIDRVAETLCTIKAGLQPGQKPLATFLFVGPTGVGKTEVAKTLARFLFGSPERMTRFDMSEYMDALAADRLIRGTDRDDGVLTRKVRQQPFCVLLLDEIEKAHPAVFDLLLQVCGEGRLSDARGRTTWFHNAIIIMTSNLGAAHRRPKAGFAGGHARRAETTEIERYYLEQVDAHFRPEFVNRIDRVIPFSALDRAQIRAVAEVSLARVREREGLAERGIDLDVADATLQRLADAGYSDAYGARALRRELEDRLVAPVARSLAKLGGRAHTGVVAVDEREGRPQRERERAIKAAGRRVLARADVGELAIDVSVGSRKVARRTMDALEQVSSLRRSARAALELDPVRELRERKRNLIAELGYGTHQHQRNRSRWQHSAELARLQSELAKIRGTVETLDERMDSIESAEELTIAALYEGEDASFFLDTAVDAHAELRREVVDALLLAKPQDKITIQLHEPDRRGALALFLLPLLDELERRRWVARFHVAGDRPGPGDVGDRVASDWPRDRPWGPPRGPAWIRRRLVDDLDPERGPSARRPWRNVLVSLDGRHAGSILLATLGLLRYDARYVPEIKQASKNEDPSAHLFARWVADLGTITKREWEADDELERAKKPRRFGVFTHKRGEKLDAIAKRVEFRADGTLGGTLVPVATQATPETFWASVEDLLFVPLVQRAYAGEEGVRG